MTKFKVTYLLMLALVLEDAIGQNSEAEPRISTVLKPPDKTLLHKSVPYHSKPVPVEKPQPSFMSKLAGWIFPFGGSDESKDLVPQETKVAREVQHHYLPPPPPRYGPPGSPDCNPCDEEPWVPVATNHGHKTVIGFVQPSHRQPFSYNPSASDLENLKPPDLYGPPSDQYSPVNSASDPIPQKVSFNAQMLESRPIPPKQEFGPLFDPQIQNVPEPKDYMLPPPVVAFSVNKPPRFKLKNNKPQIFVKPPPTRFPPRRPPRPVYNNANNIPTTHLEPIHVNTALISDVMVPPPPPVIIEHKPHFPQSSNPEYHEIVAGYLTPPKLTTDFYAQSFPVPSAPQELLPLPTIDSPSFDIVQAIPIPNLSPKAIPPLHGPTNFHTSFDSLPQQQHTIHNVQIVPSIKVADYLSTIEHPINLIQSPIVDLNVKDDIHPEESFEDQKHEQDDKPSSPAPPPSPQPPAPPIDNYLSENQQKSTIIPDNEQKNKRIPFNFGNNPVVLLDVDTDDSNFPDKTNYKDREHNKDNVGSSSNVNHNVDTLNDQQQINENPHITTSGGDQNYNTAGTQDPSETQINFNLLQQLLLNQNTFDNVPQIPQNSANHSGFTSPTLDYSQWQPTGVSNEISTSMVPPPPSQPTWLYPSQSYTTTKKPKKVQIIIPYVSEKRPFAKENSELPVATVTASSYTNKPYTTLLPVYTPPSSTEESLWSKFVDDFNTLESKKITATAFTPSSSSTPISNIHDVLKGHGFTNTNSNYNDLPFDIITLQKNIDHWTQQEYSNNNNIPNTNFHKGSNQVATSKKIPDEYFATRPYTTILQTTSKYDDSHIEYEAAGTNQRESKLSHHSDKKLNDNLVLEEATTTSRQEETTVRTNTASGNFPSPFSGKDQKSLWEVAQVTVSPVTKEKVYIVTPQSPKFFTTTPSSAWSEASKVQNGRVINQTSFAFINPKFLIKIDEKNTSEEDDSNETNPDVKVIFSEWPHLINNLQTTTTAKSTSRHPLFGLMGTESYTPPPNTTVQTIAGHSRVVTVVTPSTAARKTSRSSTSTTSSPNSVKDT